MQALSERKRYRYEQSNIQSSVCVCVCLRLFVNFNIAENAWADLNCAQKEKKNTILYHF